MKKLALPLAATCFTIALMGISTNPAPAMPVSQQDRLLATGSDTDVETIGHRRHHHFGLGVFGFPFAGFGHYDGHHRHHKWRHRHRNRYYGDYYRPRPEEFPVYDDRPRMGNSPGR